MTVRTPLAEVLNTPLNQPELGNMVFIVSQGGTELTLTAAKAGVLLSNKGETGYTGSTGTQGLVGYTGSTGTQGPSGYVGSTGTIGYTGSTGTQGAVGFTGSRGYLGSTGTQGLVGFTGSRGVVGYTGSASTATGPIGPTGFTGSGSAYSGTSTNIAGGIQGSIPIQSASSTTAFIAPGSNGSLLRYNGTTATWVSTSSLLVSNSQASEQSYVTILPAVGRTGDQYLTMVNGGTGYYSAGIQSDIRYNVTNKILSAPNVTVSTSTVASSTITGALVVAGGVGIGGKVYIGNATSIAGKDDTVSTTTGALVVAGGVGIGQDLRVGGIIYGTISGSISSAANLVGGAAGNIPYQTAPSTTGFVSAGTAGWLLSAAGTASPVWKNTSTLTVGYAVNVLGDGAGSVLFQTANNVTGKLVLGSPGQVLTVNPGGTAPYWAAVPTSSGGAADTSNTSTNLAGGLSGQMPYQISVGRTGFTTAGTTGQILTSGGTGSPVWTDASSIFSGAANLAGGTAMSIVYQSSTGNTAYLAAGTDGQVLQTHGTGAMPTWTSISSISGINTATNLANGAAGSIPVQSAPGATTFIPIGTSGYILTSNGSTAAWAAPAAPGASSTTTATNLANGSLGQVPYQSGAGATSFFGPGTSGQLLVSQGAAAPAYTNTSSIRVGYANASTNLSNGTAGQIPYQLSAGSTRFTGPGTTGQLLISDGTNGPYFVNTSSVSVGWAAVAGSVAPGALIQGIQGIQGTSVTGAQGIQGTSGGLGNTGYTGSQGTAGGTGAQGIQGITGGFTTGADSQINSLGVGTAASGVTGEIRATNEITAYYSSDSRLKENVTVIKDALEKVRSLSGVMFDWTDDVINQRGGEDGYFVRKHDTGIIAQNVETVLPEVVATREDGFLAVKYEKLAGLIIQAINELANDVDELKKKIV